MTDDFHKFPHTPHLLWLGTGVPREDKVLPRREAESFLDGEVSIEEKVDGANLGLSVGPDGRLRAQSRGNYLAPGRAHPQWAPLWGWLAQRERSLSEALGPGCMLFGEWVYAVHTVYYANLPDWFLAFDIYDIQQGRFWSAARRNAWAGTLDVKVVPEIFRGRISLAEVPESIGKSSLGAAQMEGIYLRRDDDLFLRQRAKVVTGEFKQQIEEHWSRRSLVPNRLASP